MKYSLNDEWKLSFTNPKNNKSINTYITIPSNIESELVRLGLIDNYLPADDYYATYEFEYVNDWHYSRYFDAPQYKTGEKLQIVFEGIDTIADVFLNGILLGKCNNMHLTYKFDISEIIKPTNNKLEVKIYSSELWAREHLHDMFSLPHDFFGYFNSQSHLRKARHQWGWDNAPRLITSGIFRSVYIEALPEHRFVDVYHFTKKIDNNEALLGFIWTYSTTDWDLRNHKLRFTLYNCNGEIAYSSVTDVFFVKGYIDFTVPLDKISLWWPVGMGEPNLCKLEVVMEVNDIAVATWSGDWGIRTIKLLKTETITENNEGEMVFVVNGHRTHIRGTNWKPLDPLPSKASQKISRAIDEVRALNCNMIRIWGGGIYEDAEFFELCNRYGIMVWQDFMLACETPPTDEEYCNMMREEAQQIIEKQRNYACLALWCGDNENDNCTSFWINAYSNTRPSDNKIARQILKDAVKHFDPYRDYVESSPFVADVICDEFASGKEETLYAPELHLYPDARFYGKTLRESKFRFIGETGPINVNALSCSKDILKRELPRLKRLWNAPVVRGAEVHQSDYYCARWRNAGKELCIHRYGRDFTFEELNNYIIAINTACADIYKDAIEYSRVMRWNKTGVIWWSMLDMWPMAFNYSVIDSNFGRKLPFYWIRQSQQVVAVMGVKEKIDGKYYLYAVNDSLNDEDIQYTVYAYDKDGNEQIIESNTLKITANSSQKIHSLDFEEHLLVFRWEYNGKVCFNHIINSKTPCDFEVMKRWVKIASEKCGYFDEVLEFKLD